ncbi:MAG: hypothetical protein QCI38_01725 [Candidatus Thermoplasmatota archaeon]|nr:hypothetical protein [Candidatus Thermoplasmatota archaeon]
MAKKRRQKDEEKEAPAFVPPFFDEKEFMENEIKNSKIALYIFMLAIAFAVVSMFLTRLGQWSVAFFLGVLFLISIPNIFMKLNLDTSHLKKKEWLGNYVMFLFAWIGIWILLCNPPFTDLTYPDVQRLEIYSDYDNGTWASQGFYLEYNPSIGVHYWRTPGAQEMDWPQGYYPNKDFNMTLVVTDNVGVESVVVNITPYENLVMLDTWQHVTDSGRAIIINKTFRCTQPGDYIITITVRDVNGNSNVYDRDWDGKMLSFKVLGDSYAPRLGALQIEMEGEVLYNLTINNQGQSSWQLIQSNANVTAGQSFSIFADIVDNAVVHNATAIIRDSLGAVVETIDLAIEDGLWTGQFTISYPGLYKMDIHSFDVNGNRLTAQMDSGGNNFSINVE